MQIVVRPDIADALAAGAPVVALESTIIAHGLPRPRNLEVAREIEARVRDAGAHPATIAVLDGRPHIGLTAAQLRHVASADIAKLSTHDLAAAAAAGRDGATTVAATAWLAHRAGVTVFATGGIGGVHRDAGRTWDVSADLAAVARTPVIVVCSGVKSILDTAATLEHLETLGVPVVGYGTDRFAGFYRSDAGHPVAWRADSAEHVAAIHDAQRALGLPAGLVVAHPVAEDAQLDAGLHDRALADGLAAAAAQGVVGADLTPFLLAHFHRATGGRSLDVNVALVLGNAGAAAAIARALTA